MEEDGTIERCRLSYGFERNMVLTMGRIMCGLFFLAVSLTASGQAVDGLVNPSQIVVKGGRLYVADDFRIKIYALESLEKIGEFGRRGQGPGEFQGRRNVNFVVRDDKIIVASANKVCFFSLKGVFLKEFRKEPAYASYIVPASDTCFVSSGLKVERSGQTPTQRYFQVIDIWNRNTGTVKEVFSALYATQVSGMEQLLRYNFAFSADQERIFVAKEKGFNIDVFNVDGTLLNTISLDVSPIKLERSAFFQYFSEQRNLPLAEVEQFSFSDNFPAIRSIHISGENLYVMTWRVSNDAYEFYVLDVNGDIVGRKLVPLKSAYAYQPYPFHICGDKVYQLVEAEDESWKLCVIELDWD